METVEGSVAGFCIAALPTCWENYLNGNAKVCPTELELIQQLPTCWENYLNGNVLKGKKFIDPLNTSHLLGKLFEWKQL